MIRLDAVSRFFKTPGGRVDAVVDASLTLASGEGLVLRGPSGSGKSTLLHMLGCMQRPTSGQLDIDGVDPWAGSPAQRAALRRREIGFVFQEGHLLPWCSLIDNVCAAGADAATATMLLDRVGLGDRSAHLPGEVSGGEQQRAAVARALVGDPGLLLADEPTGTIDAANARAVLDLLEATRAAGAAVVFATHADAVPSPTWRTLELDAGRIVEGP